MVQILNQIWDDGGGGDCWWGPEVCPSCCPALGRSCLSVCGVICRREQCAHQLLETRSWKRRSWVLTAPETILCSWAWSSPEDGGKHSPNSFSELARPSLAQWKTCFQAKYDHSIPCNLGGMEIAAIDWNPWVAPGTLPYNYQLWLSWIEVDLLPFTACDYSLCYEME